MIQEGGHADYDALLKAPFPKQTGGYFDLPKGPGLGIELDEEALRRHAPKGGLLAMDRAC